jgi:hypothetical protein
MQLLFLPHERPQLFPIVVGIVTELLLELADDGYWVLERVLPALEGPGIGRFGRHSACKLKQRGTWSMYIVTCQSARCYVSRVSPA